MVTQSQAAAARYRAETQMTDTCTVTRAGTTEWNNDTLENTTSEPATIYTGRFKAKGVNAIQRDYNSASQLLVSQDATVSFPVAESAAIQRGDVLTWTGSLNDPALVGRKVRIAGLASAQSFSTARRYRVEELS